MAKIITEEMIEKAALELLQSKGFKTMYCFTKSPDDLKDGTGRTSKKQCVLPEVLLARLKEINSQIPESILKNIAADISNTSTSKELMAENYSKYNLLLHKIPVEFEKDGKRENDFVSLVDFNDVSKNDFTVCSQFWIQGQTYFRRPDLIIFVNGLPFVFIELKNSDVNVKMAFDDNLTNYKRDIPQLFFWNQLCVLSNGIETRTGSFLAEYGHFFEWLKIESEDEKPNRKEIHQDGISLEYLINGLLEKVTLLDYIENFILFYDGNKKIIAKNHQFLGVNSAIDNFKKRANLDGKLGVFWHTQGSGKSFSMVFFVRKVNRKIKGNFTFLMLTDREDLNGQLFKNFMKTGVVSEKDKAQPKNAKQLREYLSMNKPFIFTLIQKFRYEKGKKYPILSERDDIIVLVDEAHRTQYKDLAENMRVGIPNAQFIAFTGTPLLGSKRLTNAWFGDYVSEYNFAQSIEDGATLPLYYSKRVPEVNLININLDDQFIDIIEHEDLTDEEQRYIERHYARELEVLKRDDRLNIIARDIVDHFPNRGFLGKGMVISVDKYTTVKMYDKVQLYWREEIRSLNKQIFMERDIEKAEKLKKKRAYMNQVQMAVVISKEDGEEEKFAKAGLDIVKHRKRLESIDEYGADVEDNFKDPNHPLSLVFVCAMWLTGFDAPSVSTIYLDKPMKGHTLMQTIARANRVYPGKMNGLIVDYLNIFKQMKKALSLYALPDEVTDMPVKDIESLKDLIENTIKECQVFCQAIGINLEKILKEDRKFNQLTLFNEAANILLSNDELKLQYRIYANLAQNLYEACKPEIFTLDFDNRLLQVILYLQGIISGTVDHAKLENAKQAVDQMLDYSVEALTVSESHAQYGLDDVFNTMDSINLVDLDIEKVSRKIKDSPYKNIEISKLREFIEEKLEELLNRNVTRVGFSEMYRSLIDRYNAGGSANENFYEELLDFIQKMTEEEERHKREGLSEEELELFDLLKKEKLTQEEEQKVKLSAKNLYQLLTTKENSVLVIDWFKDEQPRQVVYSGIRKTLNDYLPESYDRLLFQEKTEKVYLHVLDQAVSGRAYVAS